ncbi:NERD domain-containing protein [Paracerasibacillus soli]|uniref:NERD domain-containing protein n=1 Tax=Paracerasibacillus soli TaxID=480284 RepID=A0ABU5CSE2_9BACI|nr:NERD domain-containing protein [Virgibacillus soli]MDY0408734.1 NERD domain-containing protein [Virgibacillus soli]
MAQLIKMYNYISRYEWNIYRYPSQFIRMKKEHWDKVYNLWSLEKQSYTNEVDAEEEMENTRFFSKWKLFSRKNETQDFEEESKTELPETLSDLKRYFLDKLLPTQIKWASSTISYVSFVKQTIYQHELLQYFLQRFPDTYLLMYYPVFSIKNVPVDGEIILISPIGIEVIYILEEDNATFVASDERSWVKVKDNKESKFLSPMVSLKRTEHMISSIFKQGKIDFPIHKVILSRKNKIVHTTEPYRTKLVGVAEYEKMV